jgi:hypothetical protein
MNLVRHGCRPAPISTPGRPDGSPNPGLLVLL